MPVTMPTAPTAQQLKINVNPNNYATKLPSLMDVQKQYGLQDPAKYANSIANADAQSKLDGINVQRGQIDQNLRLGQSALDVDYFHQYRQSQEAMAQRGMNAGIEAQANTQLDMNRQGQLSNLYMDANRQKDTLNADTRRVEVERQAQALQIRHTELQSQIDLAFKKGDFMAAENAKRMQLDIEKEKSRIDGLQTSYSNKNSNYWNTQDQIYKNNMAAMDRKKMAIQQAADARDYAFKVQQAHADAAYRNASLAESARNRQASLAEAHAAASQKAHEQAVQQQHATTKMISDATIAARTGSTNIANIMRGLMNAHTDGLLSSAQYTQAVKAAGQANYEHMKYGKK